MIRDCGLVVGYSSPTMMTKEDAPIHNMSNDGDRLTTQNIRHVCSTSILAEEYLCEQIKKSSEVFTWQ